jgi:hypothetical protein
MSERIELAVSGATEAMLRRHPCVKRGGTLADAAAEVLAADAVRQLLGGLPTWYERHEVELLVAVEDGETALDEAV